MKVNNIYEVIIIAYLSLSLGLSLANDTKSKEKSNSFLVQLLVTALWLTLLYLAGLFH